MSNQQIVLLVIVSALTFAAVPGLIMGVPEAVYESPGGETHSARNPTADDGDTSPENHLIRPPDSLPETELTLKKTSEAERQEIKFARKININRADRDQLQQIPGVGEATAERIVKFRTEGNQFFRVEDLTNIKLIGSKTVEKMKPHITVGKEYQKRQSSRPEKQKIDLNNAERAELKQLPGIGQVTAERIIRYREQHGGFSRPDELKNVSGIGTTTYARVKDRITATGSTAFSNFTSAPSTSSAGAKIDINSASSSELEELPGIGPATAAKILDYREQHGPFSSVDGLDDVSGIGAVTLEKIRPRATAN